MVLSAPNGKWLRTNRKLGDILGYDDGLSGLSFRAIFHADDLDAHLALLEKLTANEVPFTEIEARLVRKDGSITWGFITTSLQRDTEGAPAYFLTVVENIWRRAALMREVAERQRIEDELRRAKDVADKANQAKSEFLSTMSHELRTPMNAILGFAQMLELNPRMPLTEDQKTYVDHITSGGRHLVRLIDQVLDLAKIEAGMMTLSIERIQLEEICRECLTLVNKEAEKRYLKIHSDLGATLRIDADHTRFMQALLNLLSNAVKYNREGGAITLASKEIPDNMIRVSVADSGNGIAKDDQGGLFEAFNRIGMEASNIEGTGIGLTITKKLVEAMGGRMGFESEV